MKNLESIKLDNGSVEVNTKNLKISVYVKMADQELYTLLKDLWMTSEYHIMFPFPMVGYTDIVNGINHLSMTNGWEIIGAHNLYKI